MATASPRSASDSLGVADTGSLQPVQRCSCRFQTTHLPCVTLKFPSLPDYTQGFSPLLSQGHLCILQSRRPL